jgi:trimeric autotransporter adhesin
MKKLMLLSSKNVFSGAALVLGLMGNSAWAACTAGVGGTMWNGAVSCVDTVNNTETGLATTNANLVTGDATTLAAANNYTNAKAAETLKSANTYTDTRAAETLKSANAFTSEQVSKLESKTAGGVAAIAAMASVPQLSAGKDFSVGVGVGSYDGKTALSIGVHKRFNDNMTARFNFASGVGSGSKPVVGAGAAWEF